MNSYEIEKDIITEEGIECFYEKSTICTKYFRVSDKKLYKEVWVDGSVKYFNGNKLHRENGPAVKLKNGDKYWFKDGKKHRDNGPAMEYNNGSKEYWVNGKRHREDGPAMEIVKINNKIHKIYYINNIRYDYYNWVAIVKPNLTAFV